MDEDRCVEAAIGYAIANDYREDSHNPAAWKNNIEHLMTEAEAKDGHHAALPYELRWHSR